MIYILVKDFGYDGSNNIWAGNNLVQLFDQVNKPRNMSLVEDDYYDLCVNVFDAAGECKDYIYLLPVNVKSFEDFKKLFA